MKLATPSQKHTSDTKSALDKNGIGEYHEGGYKAMQHDKIAASKLASNLPGPTAERSGAPSTASALPSGVSFSQIPIHSTVNRVAETHVMRDSAGSEDFGDVTDTVSDGLTGGGQPLDAESRGFLEPRFGHDFSQVRIHTDSRASQSAESIAARAYTVGADIAFRSGEYQPGSSDGKRLLAHEITHVIQQGGAQPHPDVGDNS
jgi:hypothetical protein